MTTTTRPRKVQAVNPVTGDVVTRSSKTKTYTHALVIFRNERPAYTIPAGEYTIPAHRIRGHRIAAYTTRFSVDYTERAETAAAHIVSFHEGFVNADKAGRAYISKSASVLAENRATYGDLIPNVPYASRYQIVPVEEV